ncbi:NTP pyrophosphohydrolase [Phytomonospora endophytica]|uniref:NTP pyrophosphohydrolase n=1 Tax=Phytomonospora endophytica TaxID=714109 RepID=A0A841FV10_9ACTN|nr:NTP pyrophosphohydrolase [Phytomonospora endophytica]MBB6035820.1 hypothetical protein [Phytomonospora endophytica]GIG71462.1 hypothetical protein Pen01_77570 [Phytomonospora endophytica]
MGDSSNPLVIVDAANVVGSVPDGWWKDRVGATTRLRDRIAGLAGDGVRDASVPEWAAQGPVEVVMVVEGKARGVTATETVSVVSAPGSGDDAIVDLVAGAAPRPTLVVTADRALRDRVMALGAVITGPRSINRIGNN